MRIHLHALHTVCNITVAHSMQCVQIDSHHVFVVGKTSVLSITFNTTVAHCMQCVQIDSHHVFVVGKTSVLLITFNITVAHCMQCVQIDSHHVFVSKTSVLLITFQYYNWDIESGERSGVVSCMRSLESCACVGMGLGPSEDSGGS